MKTVNIPEIAQQASLVLALRRCLLDGDFPHLCIAGPVGCAQEEAVNYMAKKLGVANKPLTVYRSIPEELSWHTPAQAVEAVRIIWAKARGGILYIGNLENIFADVNALPILETFRVLLSENTNVSFVVAGDVQAVVQLHAINPDLHNYFNHAVVKPLTPAQLGMLTTRYLKENNVLFTESFTTNLETELRKAPGMGNLRNSRVARKLARDLSAKGAARSIDINDLDLSVLQLDRDIREMDGYGQLEKLIGLADVKKTVKLWASNASLVDRREQLGLNAAGMGQHMVFKGPAGTAKTTVARIVSRILAQSGALATGHLVEVQKGDIISDVKDQTARRVIELVKRSLGGVLFIDEAYTLTSDTGERDAGKEAVDTLLKMMEDYRDEFVVIAAGYPSEMEQFLNSNPGLRSRFVRIIEFPSYSSEDLCLILKHLAAERGYAIDSGVYAALEPRLKLASKYPGFGNGRHVRNQLETAIMRQGDRVTSANSDSEIATLVAEDFVDAIHSSGASTRLR